MSPVGGSTMPLITKNFSTSTAMKFAKLTFKTDSLLSAQDVYKIKSLAQDLVCFDIRDA